MSEALFSLLVFVLLMVGTPGPANMLAMIGGARLGVGPCLGFIVGLTIGKVSVNVLFGQTLTCLVSFGVIVLHDDTITEFRLQFTIMIII